MYDVELNDNDVKTPLKRSRVSEAYYVQEGAVIVQEQPRFDLLDCLLCWYCPGVFLISRVCCPPPPQTVVKGRVVGRPVPSPKPQTMTQGSR